MKPASFTYHAPTTVDEALALLHEHGDDARVLAGGQSLVPLMALRMSRTEHLVDLNRVSVLSGVDHTDGELRIGAMTRQATIEHDGTVAEHVPLLSRSTPFIGHFQIRNQGTIGGSLAHADPASEYPAVALALDAQLEILRYGSSRRVAAADFFEGVWSTCLEPGELLAAIRLPSCGEREGFAVDEVARRHGDFALVGTAVRVRVDSAGAVESAAISMFGMGSTPVRTPSAEEALVGSGLAEDLARIGELAVADLSPGDDIHASATYRRRVGAVSVRRALVAALEEARGG